MCHQAQAGWWTHPGTEVLGQPLYSDSQSPEEKQKTENQWEHMLGLKSLPAVRQTHFFGLRHGLGYDAGCSGVIGNGDERTRRGSTGWGSHCWWWGDGIFGWGNLSIHGKYKFKLFFTFKITLKFQTDTLKHLDSPPFFLWHSFVKTVISVISANLDALLMVLSLNSSISKLFNNFTIKVLPAIKILARCFCSWTHLCRRDLRLKAGYLEKPALEKGTSRLNEIEVKKLQQWNISWLTDQSFGLL